MEMNDMPYLLLGALASVRDDSIKSTDDMIKKGKELAGGTRSRVRGGTRDRKLEATIQDLVKKGRKESEEMVTAIGAVVKDTLDKLGIVTKSDLKAIDKRLGEVEKKLGARPVKKPAVGKKAAKKPARKAVGKKAAKKPAAGKK